MIEKAEARRIRKEVSQVLLTVWDPIGVGDIPECADEYDCCLSGIYELLTNGANDNQLLDYLYERATHHMGLSIPRESMIPTVKALRQIQLD